MKAVILAAGKGSRIKTETDGAPKSLLPLGSTTLLGQSLSHFKAVGISEIVVVTGYKRRDIADYVSTEWGGVAEIVYNPHFDTTNVLYSFWLALPYVGDEDFVFLHADTVFEQTVLHRLLEHDKTEDFVFAIDDHLCEEEEMKVIVKDGYVTEVNKSMEALSCNGEFLGLARIAAVHVPALRRHAEQLFEECAFDSFFEMAVQRMIDEDGLKVAVTDVSGLPWREVDFPEDYEAAKGFFA